MGAYIYAVLAANEEKLKGDVKMANFIKRLSEDPVFVSECEKLGIIVVNVDDAEKKGYGNLVESAKRLLVSGVDAGIVATSLGLSLAREVAKVDKAAALQTSDV